MEDANMHQRYPILLLIIFALSACAPHPPRHRGPQADSSATEQQQSLDHMQKLKQELVELKEELAKIKTSQTAEASETAAQHPVWAPLSSDEETTAGFSRYAYLVLQQRTAPDDAIALLTLLDTLAGPGGIPPEQRTLFLIPLKNAEQQPSLANYDYQTAASLSQQAQLARRSEPILLLTDGSLQDNSLAVSLAGFTAPQAKQLLQQLLKPRLGDAAVPEAALRETCWQLADLDPGRSTRIESKQGRLFLSFTNE